MVEDGAVLLKVAGQSSRLVLGKVQTDAAGGGGGLRLLVLKVRRGRRA